MDGNIGDNLKLSEALERAKAIAAKIGGSFGGVPGTPSTQTEQKTMAQAPTIGLDSGLNISGGVKRPLEGGNGEVEPPVKTAAMENDPFGAQLALQKLEQANAQKEDYFIPHNMVGLIIGRKGEQIQKLQEESKCNLQIATESGPDGLRPCTLTGTPEAIENIKGRIDAILNQATGAEEGGTQEEMPIPSDKVGLVIGKGGETIRNLQSKLGVRMAMIQDTGEITGSSKPLRISGEMSKVKAAIQAVRELIYNEGTGKEIPVPKPLVGMVIGRQGEMIKNIQMKTGAKVQFKEDDPDCPHRVALVSGGMDAVEEAANFIEEILSTAQQSGRGRGRGRGGFRGGRGGFGSRGGFGGGFNRGGDRVEHLVPSNKCGMIIGRGGETIKSIMDQSGAHVEVNRNEDMDPPGSKIFFVCGDPGQVQHAQRLIDEKLNSGPPGMHGGPGPGGHNMGPGGHRGGGGYNNHGGPPGGGHPPPPQQQQYNAPWGNSYQQPQQQQQPWQQPAQQQPPQEAPKPAPAPQQAWNPYYNYYQQPAAQQPASTPQPAPVQQAVAPATTQAAAQPAVAPGTMPGQAPPPQTQDPAQLSAYYRQQAAQAEAAAQAALANPPQPGQPDFTQQWADYYRQLATFYNSQAQTVLQGGVPAAVPGAAAQPAYAPAAAAAAPAAQPQQAYQQPGAAGYGQPAQGGYQPTSTAAPAYQQAYQPTGQ